MRAFIAAIVLCVACALFVRASAGALAGDFKAFYCAAQVAGEGADPYHAHPLYECESKPAPFGLYHARNNVTLPAPLPGYALALFRPLTLLSFEAAAFVFTIVLFSALICGAVALAKTTGTSLEVSLVAFALSVGLVSIPYGEVLPICIGALCVAALCLERDKPKLASIAIALAMIEPHVALPAALAMFLWVPKARVTLAASAAALVALSFAFIGRASNVEYIAAVLPAQAYSDITHSTQFGLSSVLYQLGMSERAAVAVGEASFVMAVVAGVALARPLARRLGNAAIVFVPVAIGMIGGPYLHLGQIAAAVPAAILLATRAKQMRWAAIFITVLLAIPWQKVAIFPLLVPCAAIITGLLVWDLAEQNLRNALRAALASAILGSLIAIGALLVAWPHSDAPRSPEVAIDASLAQATWRNDVRQHSSNGGAATIAAKIPTWAGLLLGLIASMGVAGATIDATLHGREIMQLEKQSIT